MRWSTRAFRDGTPLTYVLPFRTGLAMLWRSKLVFHVGLKRISCLSKRNHERSPTKFRLRQPNTLEVI
jgi:hypothetical protein